MVSTGGSNPLSLGPNPSGVTMVKFKYNGKEYETPNLEKKLRRMKISKEDIELLLPNNKKEEKEEEKDEVIKYHFRNTKTGYTITTIYTDLKNYNVNESDWIKE